MNRDETPQSEKRQFRVFYANPRQNQSVAVRSAQQGVEKCKKLQSEEAVLLNTLYENWLRSSIFSPSGGDKREGAGC